MTILNEIIANKRDEVRLRKERTPLLALKERVHYTAPTLSLKSYFQREGASGVIAEIKRKSPSKGQFREEVNVEAISIAYMQHGASAVSVLTDSKYFGGSFQDLQTARLFNLCPLLCKDFIIDEYQIHEARSYGADVILLIAAVLSPEEMERFTKLAHELDLEVLVEVHSEEEIRKLPEVSFDHFGINSRDLKDFTVDPERAVALANLLPKDASKVAESGISSPAVMARLRKAGFNGFLIGEHFMKANNPGKACGLLIENCRALLKQES